MKKYMQHSAKNDLMMNVLKKITVLKNN